ncbi:MAG: 23S rRNA (guanosine(2251)-2'-O)-methyltransferase RlmB [Helicobacter sp.]|nr:23S rRNA (guanosine(2251)-2'-O)-methyltransferase RlmB [Helicobacter sp.]
MNELIIFGKQPVLSALEHFKDSILEIYLAKQIDKKLFSKFKELKKPIILLDEKRAQAMAKGKNHQGFFAKITAPKPTVLSILKQQNSLLILNEITDAGNIGAIVRSAYALGIDGVIFIGNIDQTSVIRASSGAFLSMPFCFCNNALDLINELKMSDFTCIGADPKGENLAHFKAPADKVGEGDKFALFLGNEQSGLSQKIKLKLDKIISIPMMRDFDSLNVSVSAGIMMYNLLLKGSNGPK